MLKGVGAHQIWLSPENPKDLIEKKHDTYAHGNPLEERREVLIKEFTSCMSPKSIVKGSSGEKIFARGFVSTLRSEIVVSSKRAAASTTHFWARRR